MPNTLSLSTLLHQLVLAPWYKPARAERTNKRKT